MKIQFVSPVLNEEILLPRMIQSLLAQSNENWKLLIIDNSSTDSTLSIAKYWEERDLRIKVVTLNEKRKNAFESWKEALNICFKITDCSYMQIIPGDDYLLNNDYVELALQALSINEFNGLVPKCQYRNREVECDEIKYRSLFKDWSYVHLIFGIYRIADMQSAANLLFKIEGISTTFDWWLSYFLIAHKPLYSPNMIFYRESKPSQINEVNPIVIRPILDLHILKPLKLIFALRHPVRNYIKATNTDFQHYILVRGLIGYRDRIRLFLAFCLKILKVY